MGTHHDTLLDEITGGSGLRAHQGPVLPNQAIQNAALPDVRLTDDDGLDAVSQKIAIMTRGEEAGGFGFEPADILLDRGAVFGRQVLVREVNVGFDSGENTEQRVDQA